VAAAALLAAGCAAVPSVGLPQKVTGARGPTQPYVQPVPPQPQPGWSPQDVVQGFLAASASFANGHAAARKFLDPQLRHSWQPSWAVTVVGSKSKFEASRIGPANLEGESTEIVTVSLTGQQLATISNIGQYLDNPGSQVYRFKLAKFGDEWLITTLPPASPLLLTQPDFEQVYQPRNLYFWSPAGGALVPEPVFAPQQFAYADVATNLVNALLLTHQDQSSWLAAATTTEFPRGTRLLRPVTITGSVATVNLGGAAVHASAEQLRTMAAQLVTTLTSTSYGQPPLSRSVMLEVNGRVRAIDDRQLLLRGDFQDMVPGSVAHPSTLYFVSTTGAVGELPPGAQARTARGPAGQGKIKFASIAVSPGSQPELAGSVATGSGCEIYYGSPDSGAPLAHRVLPDPGGGHCTSLSWDNMGDMWVVAGRNIWVLPLGGQPVSVSPPPLPGTHPPDYRVLSLQVAPDGVRAAMLVKPAGGPPQVLLTAIVRSGSAMVLGGTATTVGTTLHSPSALSWYDPDHLLVLATRSQLYEVPANGGAPVSVGPVPAGTQSIASAGPAQIATAGDGQIMTSSIPDQIQQLTAKGTSPTYPG
jgi:hypothetical protein